MLSNATGDAQAIAFPKSKSAQAACQIIHTISHDCAGNRVARSCRVYDFGCEAAIIPGFSPDTERRNLVGVVVKTGKRRGC